MADTTLKFVPVLSNNLATTPIVNGQFIINPTDNSISVDYKGNRTTISKASLFNTLSFFNENDGETTVFDGSGALTINLPKTLKDIQYKIVEVNDEPYAGAVINEPYIEFTFGIGNEIEKKYISLKDILTESTARIEADNRIEQILAEEIRARLVDEQQIVSDVSLAVSGINNNIEDLSTDISAVKYNISTLSYNISTLIGDISGRFATVNGDINGLRNDISAINYTLSGKQDALTFGNGLIYDESEKSVELDTDAIPKSWIEVYDESGVEDILIEGNLGEYVKYCGETTENYENGRLYQIVEKTNSFKVGNTYNRIYFNTTIDGFTFTKNFYESYVNGLEDGTLEFTGIDYPGYEKYISGAVLADTRSTLGSIEINLNNNSFIMPPDPESIMSIEYLDIMLLFTGNPGIGMMTGIFQDPADPNSMIGLMTEYGESADAAIEAGQINADEIVPRIILKGTSIHAYKNGEEMHDIPDSFNSSDGAELPDYIEFDHPFTIGSLNDFGGFINVIGPSSFSEISTGSREFELKPVYVSDKELRDKISEQISINKEIFEINNNNARDILIKKNFGKTARWEDLTHCSYGNSSGAYAILDYGQLYLIYPKEDSFTDYSNKIYFHKKIKQSSDFCEDFYNYLGEYFESANKLTDNNSSLEISLAFSGAYDASRWDLPSMSLSTFEDNMFRYGGCTVSKYSNDNSSYPNFYITLYPRLDNYYNSLESTNYSKERFILKFQRRDMYFGWVCENRNDKEIDEIDRSITFYYNTCSESPINWIAEGSDFSPNSYSYQSDYNFESYINIKDDSRYITVNYQDKKAAKVLTNLFSKYEDMLDRIFDVRTEMTLEKYYVTKKELESEISAVNNTIDKYSMWYKGNQAVDYLEIGSHAKYNTELSIISEGARNLSLVDSKIFYFRSLSVFYIDAAFRKLNTFKITEDGYTWVYCILMDSSNIENYYKKIESLADAEKMYRSAFLVAKCRMTDNSIYSSNISIRLNGPDNSYIEENGYNNIKIYYGDNTNNPAIITVYRKNSGNQNITSLSYAPGITTLNTNDNYVCGVEFRDYKRINYFNGGAHAFSQCFKNFVSTTDYPNDNNDVTEYEKFYDKIALTPMEINNAIENKLANIRGSISNAAVINVRADTLLEPLVEGMVLKAGDKLHFDTSDTSAYDTILNNLSYSNGMAFLSSNDVGFGGLLAALDFSVPTNGAVTSKSLIMVTGQSLLDATFIYSTSAGSYGPLSWGAGFQNLDPLGDIKLSESSNIISVHNETNWNGTLISVKHLVYDRTLKDDQFYKVKNSRNVPLIGSVVSLDNLYLDKVNIENYLSSLEYWNASTSPFNMGNYVAPIIMLQSAVSGYTNRNIPPEKVLLGAVRDNGTYKLKLMSEWGFPTNTIYDSSKKSVSPYDSDGWYMTADKYCKNLLNDLIQKVPELTSSTWVYTGGSRYNNYYSLVFTFDEGKLFKNTILGKEDDVILQSKLDETIDGVKFAIKNKKYNEIKDAPITRKSVLDIANPSEYFINNGQTFPDSSTVNPSDIKINKKKKPIFTSTDTKDWYRNGSSSVWCKNLAALMDENSGVTYYLALGYYPYNGRDYTYVMIDTTNFETTALSFSSWSMIRTSLYNPGLEGTVGWLADDLGEYFSSKGITTDLDLLVLDQDLFDKFFVSEIGDERLYRTAVDISASYKVLDTTDIDSVPDESSGNPISSAAVYTVMSGKQDTLTWDVVPTESSDNPVTSDGIYSAIQDVREVASGKTASYVITSKTDITGTENSNGKGFTAVTDISGLNIANLKVGDNIYLIDTDVPDYWVSDVSTTNDIVTSISLNILETAKIDICDDYTQIDANSTKLFTGRAIYQALNALKTALTPVSSSIAFNSWISDATIDPYKYKSSAVVTCGSNATIRLINDQPVAFANYGFVIGSVTPLTSTTATVTVYAVDDPSSATLTISVLEG